MAIVRKKEKEIKIQKIEVGANCGASSLCRGTACRVFSIHHGNAVMLLITKNYLIIDRWACPRENGGCLSYYIRYTIYEKKGGNRNV